MALLVENKENAAVQTLDRPLDAKFRKDFVAIIPFLRAFARQLSGDREVAEDLAQETLAKAWQARSTFRSGTNLKAWLFTILRNEFYSHKRRAWRNVRWDESLGEGIAGPGEEQYWAAILNITAKAFTTLSADQREALLLVAIHGFRYDAAAKIEDCAAGTMKSRVARARKALSGALGGAPWDKTLHRRGARRGIPRPAPALETVPAVTAGP